MQVLIDGFIERQLDNLSLKWAICRLVEEIGMTPIGQVVIEPFPEYDYGVSAVQFLAESHIVVNYWRNQIAIDIFSCKGFDQQKAVDFCIEHFLIREITRNQLIERGFL